MTTPTAPRLTGNPQIDTRVLVAWANDLYKALKIDQDAVALDLTAIAPLTYTSTNREVKIDDTGSNGDILQFNGTVWELVPLSAGGDVNGPSGSTTNAVAKYADATGNEIANSGITIDGTNNLAGVNSITCAGALNHTGSTLGVFNTTATTQADAYTQTYAAADRTLDAYTADDESVAYTGVDNAQAGTVYAQLSDLNNLRTAYENLRVLVEDAAQMLNAVVDDLQDYGFLQ